MFIGLLLSDAWNEISGNTNRETRLNFSQKTVPMIQSGNATEQHSIA